MLCQARATAEPAACSLRMDSLAGRDGDEPHDVTRPHSPAAAVTSSVASCTTHGTQRRSRSVVIRCSQVSSCSQTLDLDLNRMMSKRRTSVT